MPATTKGAWKLQEVRDALLSNEWSCYRFDNDGGCLFGWGNENTFGIFLNLNAAICISSPVQIPGTSWQKVFNAPPFSAIVCKTDNTLWVWGSNPGGQLGINASYTRFSSPVQLPGTSWCHISGGANKVAALKTDGTLWGWGCNSCGGFGDNTTIDKSSPVQIPGTSWCWVSSTGRRPNNFGGSLTHAIKTDGTLWTWGGTYAGYGYGINTGGVIYSSPIQVPGSWTCVNSASGVAIATKSDGTLWVWGYNYYCSLGLNDRTSRYSPTQIPGNTWCFIKGDSTFSPEDYNAHSALVGKTDGTMWAFGRALGSGDNRSYGYNGSPKQIPGTAWCEVIAGGIGQHTFFLKSDNTMWATGISYRGALGNNTNIDFSSPIQIAGTTWKSMGRYNADRGAGVLAIRV